LRSDLELIHFSSSFLKKTVGPGSILKDRSELFRGNNGPLPFVSPQENCHIKGTRILLIRREYSNEQRPRRHLHSIFDIVSYSRPGVR
jgi:hypothetical protein